MRLSLHAPAPACSAREEKTKEKGMLETKKRRGVGDEKRHGGESEEAMREETRHIKEETRRGEEKRAEKERAGRDNIRKCR